MAKPKQLSENMKWCIGYIKKNNKLKKLTNKQCEKLLEDHDISKPLHDLRFKSLLYDKNEQELLWKFAVAASMLNMHKPEKQMKGGEENIHIETKNFDTNNVYKEFSSESGSVTAKLSASEIDRSFECKDVENIEDCMDPDGPDEINAYETALKDDLNSIVDDFVSFTNEILNKCKERYNKRVLELIKLNNTLEKITNKYKIKNTHDIYVWTCNKETQKQIVSAKKKLAVFMKRLKTGLSLDANCPENKELEEQITNMASKIEKLEETQLTQETRKRVFENGQQLVDVNKTDMYGKIIEDDDVKEWGDVDKFTVDEKNNPDEFMKRQESLDDFTEDNLTDQAKKLGVTVDDVNKLMKGVPTKDTKDGMPKTKEFEHESCNNKKPAEQTPSEPIPAPGPSPPSDPSHICVNEEDNILLNSMYDELNQDIEYVTEEEVKKFDAMINDLAGKKDTIQEPECNRRKDIIYREYVKTKVGASVKRLNKTDNPDDMTAILNETLENDKNVSKGIDKMIWYKNYWNKSGSAGINDIIEDFDKYDDTIKALIMLYLEKAMSDPELWNELDKNIIKLQTRLQQQEDYSYEKFMTLFHSLGLKEKDILVKIQQSSVPVQPSEPIQPEMIPVDDIPSPQMEESKVTGEQLLIDIKNGELNKITGYINDIDFDLTRDFEYTNTNGGISETNSVDYAIRHKKYEILQLLINKIKEQNPDINMNDLIGINSSIDVINNCDIDTLKIMLNKNNNFEISDSDMNGIKNCDRSNNDKEFQDLLTLHRPERKILEDAPALLPEPPQQNNVPAEDLDDGKHDTENEMTTTSDIPEERSEGQPEEQPRTRRSSSKKPKKQRTSPPALPGTSTFVPSPLPSAEEKSETPLFRDAVPIQHEPDTWNQMTPEQQNADTQVGETTEKEFLETHPQLGGNCGKKHGGNDDDGIPLHQRIYLLHKFHKQLEPMESEPEESFFVEQLVQKKKNYKKRWGHKLNISAELKELLQNTMDYISNPENAMVFPIDHIDPLFHAVRQYKQSMGQWDYSIDDFLKFMDKYGCGTDQTRIYNPFIYNKGRDVPEGINGSYSTTDTEKYASLAEIIQTYRTLPELSDELKKYFFRKTEFSLLYNEHVVNKMYKFHKFKEDEARTRYNILSGVETTSDQYKRYFRSGYMKATKLKLPEPNRKFFIYFNGFMQKKLKSNKCK